jgi:O-antigen/teichoic acid export membrane protein
LGLLTVLQAGTQAINIVTGFLLVRWLSKPEFAWFTLGNSATAVFTTLVDPGTGLGMQAVGGRVADKPEAFRQVLASALSLRWKLGLVSAVLSLPIPLWLLLENEAPLPIALAILAVNALGFFAVLTNGTLGAALKLQGRFRQALLSDFAAVIARLLLVSGATLFLLDAITATLTVVIASFWQYCILRRGAADLLRNSPAPVAEHQSELLQQVRSMRVYNLFQFLHGQVAVWLLSISTDASTVADYGALSRLGAIFSTLAILFYQLVIPALSRSPTTGILKKRLWLGFAAFLGMSLIFVLLGWLGATWILNLFGASYVHLTREVPWMILLQGLYSFSVILWWFNASKGWVSLSKYSPVLTVAVLLLTYAVLRPETVLEIIWFSMISLIPSIALGVGGMIRAIKTAGAKVHADE